MRIELGELVLTLCHVCFDVTWHYGVDADAGGS